MRERLRGSWWRAGANCGWQRLRLLPADEIRFERRQQLNVDNSSGLAVESGQTAERLQRDSERAKEQATADTKERGRARRGSPPSSVRLPFCLHTDRTAHRRRQSNEEQSGREKVDAGG